MATRSGARTQKSAKRNSSRSALNSLVAASKNCAKGSRRAGISSSKKADFPKPFALDLGAVSVTVEIGELHENAQAMALYGDRRIILDTKRIGGQNLTATLWHEVLHHLDELYLGGVLGGDKDDCEEHRRLNTLANVLDLTLTRNWTKFAQLYGAKGKANA